MTNNLPEHIQSIDPPLTNTIGELREYARRHPEARAVRAALDGILEGLVEKILAGGVLEPEHELTVALLEELATLFPDSPTPLLHLSKIFIDRSRYEAALKYAEAGLAANPGHADLAFNRALSLQEMGKPDAAIEAFKRYLELNPDNPWAYNNIGDAYRHLKLYDQAENYLKLAIERDRRFIPAYYNLAMLYMDQQDWERCAYYAQIAERVDPLNKEVQLALGDAFMGLREHQSALQHLVNATLIDRDFVEAYETMSSAYVELGMFDLSIAAAQEALKLKPDSWMALANTGYSYAKQGRFAEAVKYQQEALQLDSDDEGKYKLCWDLGWNCLQIDQYSEALEYTEKAMRAREFPDIALPLNKGLALLMQGKSREANAVFDEVIKRAAIPENYRALLQAIRDIKDYISKKGVQVEKGSTLFKLLEGQLEPPS